MVVSQSGSGTAGESVADSRWRAGAAADAARRDSRSFRYPGHRQGRLSRAIAADGRRSSDLSAGLGADVGAAIDGGTRLLDVRGVLSLRDLPGLTGSES